MVVVIWASPDMDGLTAQVEMQLVKGIQDAGETACEIHLNKKNILNCHACGKGGYGACQKRGICVLYNACVGGYGLGCCECLAMMENTLSHMEIETADRLVVERFNSSYAVPAAYAAGKVFAENYKDFRFDQFDFWS